MPDIPANPDRPDLPPDPESEAFDTSDRGDFLGLEEDLGLAIPTPTAGSSETAMPAAPSAPLATWTDEEPPDDFAAAPEEASEEASGEASGEASAEEQGCSEEELWSEQPDLEDPEEDSASWLMELDGEDEFLLQGTALDGEGPGGEETEEYAPASAGRTWFTRLLFAGISIGIGFAGARYLPGSGLLNNSPGDPSPVRQPDPGPMAEAPAEPGPAGPAPVAEVVEPGVSTEVALGPLPLDSESFEGPFRPVEPTTPEVTAEVTPETAGELLPEIAAATPGETPAARTGGKRSPFVTLTGAGSRPRLTPVSPFIRSTRTPLAPLEAEPVPTPMITATENPGPVTPDANPGNPAEAGRERRTQVVKVEDMVLLPEELSGRLREASAEELSGMWMGASIPLEAIGKNSRLLTPAVGRVRVLLGGGEVFEGELYAVGQKKVWLETDLGKMALVSWQVDRIEHILTRDGTAALGEDGSQDLAGLERVRVRTPGGVFYGKVIAREGDAVTLITDQGARITLEEAVVGPAGRSATRLVDASGAEQDELAEPPTPE